ncbi:Predicted arabinose efflux permease, MFS family [Segatella oulorum]|uniref:Predicted arabinose efflux permease, MFS family n=1 Tax=Segatella oulorum TaxID=28136 RepID=A0A1T4MYU6_9BACT|nr:MFS transporter [Segatella oulorum]SJZ71798.1 Predicted arabinose efflux permease, MFS family [Segatella oulorum]
MDTQHTAIHIRLWQRPFWLLSIAKFLLCMAVYMLIPILPYWMMSQAQFDGATMSFVFLSYLVGVVLPGPFSSFLVQRFRRNNVALLAILCMIPVFYALFFISQFPLWILYVLACCFGASFGFVQEVLSSTLIVDVCDSSHRTEANYASSWFGRIALAVGPMVGLLLCKHLGIQFVFITLAVACLLALLLVSMVKFPFKTPEDEIHLVSFDRFFLTDGKWLFLNQLLIMAAVGILLSLSHSVSFYALMLLGFFFALLSQRFVFANADLKSEIVTGLFALCAAVGILFTQQGRAMSHLSPTLLGYGIGLIGSRFQMFLLKLSRHCQRGTSQSTYFLGWESGISLGLFLGWYALNRNEFVALSVSLGLLLLALAFYHFFTHHWYVQHKNR